MKKIANIFISHRHALIWTACYVFAMKFILSFLFNFDMFSGSAWGRLMHSHLYGFGGFVFGILVLAALPMYIATTAIIMRTKKPLVTIPLPQAIKKAFAPPAPPKQDAAPEPAKPEPETETFPENMPTELRGAFLRARRNGGRRTQTSAFDTSNMTAGILQSAAPTPTAGATAAGAIDTADDFPLPTDFNFTDDIAPETPSFPSFTDITFDSAPSEPSPAPSPDAPVAPQSTPSPILKKLSGAQPDGEFIKYKDKIIAVHDDPDFWIADDVDWFASGKQRPNPTIALKQRADDTGLTPVLYLAETNILDLDGRRAQWQSEGITVITNLNDLK